MGKQEDSEPISFEDKVKAIFLKLTNPLYWILFATFFGLLTGYSGPKATPLLDLLACIFCLVMAVVTLIIRIPIWIRKQYNKIFKKDLGEEINKEPKTNRVEFTDPKSKKKRRLSRK